MVQPHEIVFSVGQQVCLPKFSEYRFYGNVAFAGLLGGCCFQHIQRGSSYAAVPIHILAMAFGLNASVMVSTTTRLEFPQSCFLGLGTKRPWCKVTPFAVQICSFGVEMNGSFRTKSWLRKLILC